MVRYIIMKAKLRYALQVNEVLTEELRIALAGEQDAWREKEGAVDALFLGMFG